MPEYTAEPTSLKWRRYHLQSIALLQQNCAAAFVAAICVRELRQQLELVVSNLDIKLKCVVVKA
jgi:hypothetical protein